MLQMTFDCQIQIECVCIRNVHISRQPRFYFFWFVRSFISLNDNSNNEKKSTEMRNEIESSIRKYNTKKKKWLIWIKFQLTYQIYE